MDFSYHPRTLRTICRFSVLLGFYRAMHFSAKRGIAIAWRPSVCLSVMLVDQDHIGRKPIPPQFWGCSRCTRWPTLGPARAEALTGREAIFEEFQPTWSRYGTWTSWTDRQTLCCGITALCVASRGKKINQEDVDGWTTIIATFDTPLLLLALNK